jgi:hypothetical protein
MTMSLQLLATTTELPLLIKCQTALEFNFRSIQLTIPSLESESLSLFHDLYNFSINQRQFSKVTDFEWMGNLSPNQKFFENWLVLINTLPSGLNP